MRLCLCHKSDEIEEACVCVSSLRLSLSLIPFHVLFSSLYSPDTQRDILSAIALVLCTERNFGDKAAILHSMKADVAETNQTVH